MSKNTLITRLFIAILILLVIPACKKDAPESTGDGDPIEEVVVEPTTDAGVLQAKIKYVHEKKIKECVRWVSANTKLIKLYAHIPNPTLLEYHSEDYASYTEEGVQICERQREKIKGIIKKYGLATIQLENDGDSKDKSNTQLHKLCENFVSSCNPKLLTCQSELTKCTKNTAELNNKLLLKSKKDTPKSTVIMPTLDKAPDSPNKSTQGKLRPPPLLSWGFHILRVALCKDKQVLIVVGYVNKEPIYETRKLSSRCAKKCWNAQYLRHTPDKPCYFYSPGDKPSEDPQG